MFNFLTRVLDWRKDEITQIVFTLALIFIVYFIGYAMGRKDVVDDIRQITKELEKEAKDVMP